ncbi:MAG: DNA polymerase domain-containing protein [Haloferacaceae archaeon]
MGDGTTREIQAIEPGDVVVGATEQTPATATVTNKWRSETEILEFDLADGTTLRSSADHRIMAGNDETVDWTEGGAIEPGDYVVKPRTLPVDEPTVPTLAELVPLANQRFADESAAKRFKEQLPRGAIGELAEEFGVTAETLYHPHRDVWTPERCSNAATRYDVSLPDGGRDYRRTGVDLDRTLHEREAYLAGLVLTDGSMSQADGIRFYNTRAELHEAFPGDAPLTPDGTGCYKQNVLDYARMYAFNGLGIPFGDKNAGPVDLSPVYAMPEEYVARFLAGVIDGDGSVGTSVTVAAENTSIGDWYVRLFKRLGVYAERNGTTVRVPDAERDLSRLRERILPHMCHSEKVKRLTDLDGGQSGRTEDIPYALFEAEVGTDERRIGRDKHRRGISFKRHETTADEWEEYVFVEVEGVESVGTETTYDIETTTHNFVAEGCLVHNCEDFDVPYVFDRMEEIGGASEYDLSPDRLSRVDEVWRGGWGGPDVKGRVVFDLLYAYKRTQFTELESYRLDAVAELELDVGKERYSGDIGDLWEQEPERLLEYNLRDVELCVEIDRKQSVIAFWDEVRRFVGCLLEDAPTPGDAVDVYVLHNAHGRFALPTKGQQESEEFEGGAVFEPVTGVRENVTVLDLKCFSGDTQLLTPEGVRDITEVEVGDPVYTLNPETFECEVKPVAETHQYPNRFGELHHLSGNTHDLKITENHRLLVSAERGWDDQTPDDFEFAEYREIPESERFAFPQHEPVSGARPETFDLVDEVSGGHVVVYCDADLRSFRAQMPEAVTAHLDLAHGSSAALGIEQKVGKYLLPLSVFRSHREVVERHADHVFLKYGRSHRETPLSFETDDWLRLLGWYVTEGSVDRGAGRLTLHQQDADGRRRIQRLLDRMGIDHDVDERGVNVSNRYLLDWLADHCGEGAANKRLPDWVFDLDGSLLGVLLDTMLTGDGSRPESGLGEFWTSSDRLKEAITKIAVRCGEKPTVTKQTDGTWHVSIGKRGSFEKTTNAAVEDHDGDVFCVTAEDNHTVLAGRNGHFQWVGQSLYPMCMVTINASPETKVDPDEYDGETYHAPNGTHFRAEPDGMMREMVDELLTEREEKKTRRDEYEPGTDEYVQFDRQQAATKVIMNCFTPDTEVLTPAGVRDITDLAVGDEVYSLDPETMEMEVKPVVDTQAYPDYRDELVDIETSKVDFRVTPNHRMLVRKAERNGIEWDDYRFVEAGNLDDASNYQLPHGWDGPDGERIDQVDLTELADEFEVWCDNDGHGHTLAAEVGWYPDTIVKNDLDTAGYVFDADEFDEHRDYLDGNCSRFRVHAERGRKWIPRFYDGDDFLDLLAWYVTEGSVYTSETKGFDGQLRGSAPSVQIAQDAPGAATDGVAADGGESDHAAIGSLLDRMGFDYHVDDRGYQFTSRLLGRFLERTCGADSFEKRIPDLVFEASREQKRRFLDTLVAGDGDRSSDSAWRYTTSSERLRDDVLRLCAHLGLTANYSQDSGSWRIHCTEESKTTLGVHRSSSRSTAESGVYCVTVADNHTLLAGRNGRFQFVGQSLYGVSGWDRFRLYDKENAAAVTATGREVLSFTEDVAEEMDYQIAYGDSVTGDRPVVVRDSDGFVRIVPIADLFERAEPQPDAELLITADGGAASTVGLGKERGTLDGWEALSLSDAGEPEWQSIEEVVRHETDDPVVRLRHKFGESTTTRDHSYVVEDGDGLTEATPDDVSEPLRIPGLPDVERAETVDVYEVLRGYEREYVDGRGGDDRTKIKRVHADDEWVWFGHEHARDQSKTVRAKRHVDLDGEDGRALVRLLAAYVTEGSASTVETTNSRVGASIAESRREWLDGLKQDYQRLFDGVTTSLVTSDARDERTVEDETDAGGESVTYDDRTLKLQMMNELSAVFFREFAGQTSRGKRVPPFVFNLSDDLQTLFLDTLVEGDGSREFPRYSEAYAERNFDFETTSRELAAGLSILLTQRGRKHSLNYRDAKESYTVRTCDYYREGRAPELTELDHDDYVYDLSVAENENFVDAVGGVVLHNTDSVMLELGSDVTKSEAIDRSFDIEDHINDRYDDFARDQLGAEEHRFQIEFEKLYRRFFQAGKKKRYAGHIVWKEGKDVDDIDITGFEYKRSDIAQVTKRVQREIIEMIVRGEELDEVREYLHEEISAFESGERSLAEVGIPGGIGKRLDAYDTDTAQVRGARYANELLGTNFGRGSKPKRVYLRKVHPEFFRRLEDEEGFDPATDPVYAEFKRDPDVICFEYDDQVPDAFEVDWERMLEKTLQGPIARVIEALGMSWDEVRSGQTQTGLGQFG